MISNDIFANIVKDEHYKYARASFVHLFAYVTVCNKKRLSPLGTFAFFSNSFTCKFFDGFLHAEEAKLSFVCVWRVYNWKLFNYALLVVLEFKGTYFLNRKNREEGVWLKKSPV